MNNEEKINIISEETSIPLNTGNEPDYIAEIQKLKANTVSLDDYNRLKADNKKLINALATGEGVATASPKPEKNINELRNKLLKEGSNMDNLEYVKTAVNLREALIAQGHRDPFLPYGKGVLPTTEDVECANRVANVFRECIEYADGDPDIFTSELQRRTVDVGPIKRK